MSVTVQRIAQEPSSAALKDVNEFLVPTILSINLKKTQEHRGPSLKTDNLSSLQNGDIVTENEDLMKMSPRRKSSTYKSKKQTSSFLLEPFLKPVGAHIESNKENPVLKALFGVRSPPDLSQWTYVTKTSINNCHPFKKTEFSHDLSSDDTPVQVPKSLMKRQSKSRKSPPKRETSPEIKTTVLKEVQMNSGTSTLSTSAPSLNDNSTHNEQAVAPAPADKAFIDLSIFNKRKKILSQSSIPTGKSRPQYINAERLVQLRTLVDNAVKNHKVYSMTGCYTSVRNALKQRGWIEKIDSDVKGRRKVNKFQEIGLCQGEAEIMNRMLRNVTEDLCWLSRPYPYYCWKDFDKFEMINRLPRAYFSNKVGLCNSLQQIQWFYENGVCSTQFPRTYNMSMKDEIEAFKDDYRLTSCIGTLKWFLHTYKSGGEKAVRSPEGKVDMNVIEFALRRCAEFVKTKQHEDIDITDSTTVWDYQWDQFVTQYYKLINEGQVLKDNREGITIKTIVSNVQSMLNILKPYWPQFDIEGHQNFWIVKPGGRCCGAGIVIKNNLEQILLMVNPNSMRETRFVVQKYIERPLLIYNTKFDIRQWFLVTNVYPLTIWMYKESYLRFCSQPFTLKSTHESIHLCNNAVQRKYKNGKRDRGLPDENMWDCYTFQTYLKAIGHPDAWEKYIYPGMRESFIGALLASQETMERKKNCFELYGADFMVSDTLTDGPWLIEINSNPAMDSSTSVTARMCPQVLEDIIKVVIDRRDNKSAPTGAFEMVFKQNCPPIPPYLGMSLCIKGKKAYRTSGDMRTISRKSKDKPIEQSQYTDTEEESIGEEAISATEPRIFLETPKRDASSSDEGNSGRLTSTGKINRREIKKDKNSKRRKVDWVQKNIQDLRSFHSMKRSKAVRTSSAQNPQNSSNMEIVFRDQVLKLLGTVEMKDFVQEVIAMKKEIKSESAQKKEGDDLIVSGMEALRKKYNWCLDSDVYYDIPEDVKKTLVQILQHYREKEVEVACDNAIDNTTDRCAGFSKLGAKSCPNFDSTFEAELRKLDESEQKKAGKSKSEESVNSYYSALSSSSRNSSKTSLEYFQDWKSKLFETRRTCEDMLNKLKEFQEENSKVKFQDAVKKRMKDEVDFIKRIRQYRKSRKLGRVRNCKREQRDCSEGRDKLKMDDGRSTSSAWDSEGDAGLNLAINSETGAVRNINASLPKIKQRSRPPLPNGSSGHGRKIEVTLEPTSCH